MKSYRNAWHLMKFCLSEFFLIRIFIPIYRDNNMNVFFLVIKKYFKKYLKFYLTGKVQLFIDIDKNDLRDE